MDIPADADSVSLRLARPFLNRRVALRFDRPLGSRHPRCGFVYEVNYGYVPGTLAPDGAELDAYYLGADEPLEHAEGRCVAIVHRFDDDDDKLVVIADGATPPGDDAILAAVAFQETPGAHSIIRC
ncbi:inorganic diphosphatase [Nocardia xishanensis]|uniref:inorganic diphosphatase n=1 Tax=Nocardia xishanensis TaxID=238964 RepID=A0ABW7X6B7_9NOCA